MRVLLVVLLVYAAASLASIVMYFLDKRAARLGRWRVREKTLHAIALCGGWPGALLAQRWFRHKTVDRSFRRVFFGIVALHAALWATVLGALALGVVVWGEAAG